MCKKIEPWTAGPRRNLRQVWKRRNDRATLISWYGPGGPSRPNPNPCQRNRHVKFSKRRPRFQPVKFNFQKPPPPLQIKQPLPNPPIPGHPLPNPGPGPGHHARIPNMPARAAAGKIEFSKKFPNMTHQNSPFHLTKTTPTSVLPISGSTQHFQKFAF